MPVPARPSVPYYGHFSDGTLSRTFSGVELDKIHFVSFLNFIEAPPM
jgi:hypothetical protein